jgi:hypothetical protein
MKSNYLRVALPALVFGVIGLVVAFLWGGVLVFFGASSASHGSWVFGGLVVGLTFGTAVGVTWVTLGGIPALCGAIGLVIGARIAPFSMLPPSALWHWNVIGGLAIGVPVGVVLDLIRKRWLPSLSGSARS